MFGGGTRNTTGGYAEGNLTSVEMYDPDTNSWVPGADMPTGRRSMGGGTLVRPGAADRWRTEARRRQLPENEEYDPAGRTSVTPFFDAYTAPRRGSRTIGEIDLRGERAGRWQERRSRSGQRGLSFGTSPRLRPGYRDRSNLDPDGEEAEAEGQGLLTAMANVDGTPALAAALALHGPAPAAAAYWTPVMAKLKSEVRKQLDEKLDDGKKARLKVNGRSRTPPTRPTAPS